MGKPLSEKKSKQASLGEKLTPIEPATAIPNALIRPTQVTRYESITFGRNLPKSFCEFRACADEGTDFGTLT
jgi:hypothetical protein